MAGSATAHLVPRRGALLALALIAGAALPRAATAAEPAPPPPSPCAEDAATGEPPTISSRFVVKGPGEEGAGFVEARQRALGYCREQACTVGGEKIGRTASVYVVALLHRRPIAGFRCLAVEGAMPAGGAARAVSVPIGDLSQIDSAVAKARGQCAAPMAKPELADLRKQGDGVVAVFSCSAR